MSDGCSLIPSPVLRVHNLSVSWSAFTDPVGIVSYSVLFFDCGTPDETLATIGPLPPTIRRVQLPPTVPLTNGQRVCANVTAIDTVGNIGTGTSSGATVNVTTEELPSVAFGHTPVRPDGHLYWDLPVTVSAQYRHFPASGAVNMTWAVLLCPTGATAWSGDCVYLQPFVPVGANATRRLSADGAFVDGDVGNGSVVVPGATNGRSMFVLVQSDFVCAVVSSGVAIVDATPPSASGVNVTVGPLQVGAGVVLVGWFPILAVKPIWTV